MERSNPPGCPSQCVGIERIHVTVGDAVRRVSLGGNAEMLSLHLAADELWRTRTSIDAQLQQRILTDRDTRDLLRCATDTGKLSERQVEQ